MNEDQKRALCMARIQAWTIVTGGKSCSGMWADEQWEQELRRALEKCKDPAMPAKLDKALGFNHRTLIKEGEMFVLIDMTNLRIVAKAKTYKSAAALAYIQFANLDTSIMRIGDGSTNKQWSQFNAEELEAMFKSIGFQLDVRLDYNVLVKQARATIERHIDWLTLPFEEADLVRQAMAIPREEARPFVFQPGQELPALAQRWSLDPQTNRTRLECPHWVHFSTEGRQVQAEDAAGTAPKAPKPKPAPRAPAVPGEAKAPKAPAAPKPPKVPKAPKEPGAASERPKAGSKTGLVWDVADKLSATGATGKELRKSVIAECEKQGINGSTASVQFGKWAASKK